MDLHRDPAGLKISIHAPRVGSDPEAGGPPKAAWDFNPRSPCGERPACAAFLIIIILISIHAPRVGSDEEVRKLPLHN